VNAKVAGWTASSLPPDWSSYRDQWEAAHAVSAALAGIALLVLVAATVWGDQRSGPRTGRHVPTGWSRFGSEPANRRA
jgi:hypothetical protein